MSFSRTSRRGAFLLVAGLLLAACGPKEIRYALKVITTGCDRSADPFANVSFVQVRVTGDGLTEPLTAQRSAASKALDLPDIPVGTNRVIEVRGYDTDPSAGNGKVLSLGRSLPFDVPEQVPPALVGKSVPVNVVLRKVNSFSRVIAADNPTACVQMNVARAGHTATVLKNGKVFIAGGYTIMGGTATTRVALSDTEIFDPNLGTFTPAKDISFAGTTQTYKQPRAFHTATLIPSSGQVVLWGGEQYVGANSVPAPEASFLFYDPDVDSYGALPPRTPAAIPRAHHAVALDSAGRMLIVGGTNMSSGSPINEVEWLDPASTLYKIVDGVNLPRLEMSVGPVKKGDFIAVAGGTDGTSLVTEVTFFKFLGSTFAQQTQVNVPHLADPGRRAAASVTIRDGADLLLIGGYSDPAKLAPLGTTEVVNSQSTVVSSGPPLSPSRGQVCAALLADGSVLSIGGRVGTPSQSDGSSQLIKPSVQGGFSTSDGPTLPTPRYSHTCTALPDGTVLVTGGVDESSDGVAVVLQDAWIYQPAPAN